MLNDVRRALCSLLALGLVACSNSDDGAANPNTTPPTPPPASRATTGSAVTSPAGGRPINDAPPPKSAALPAGGPTLLPDGPVETTETTCTGSGIVGTGQITRKTRSAEGFTTIRSELAGEIVIEESP